MATVLLKGGDQFIQMKETTYLNFIDAGLSPDQQGVINIKQVGGLPEFRFAVRNAFNLLESQEGWTVDKSQYPVDGDSTMTTRDKINYTWQNSTAP